MIGKTVVIDIKCVKIEYTFLHILLSVVYTFYNIY
jgi:hypothetical protein